MEKKSLFLRYLEFTMKYQTITVGINSIVGLFILSMMFQVNLHFIDVFYSQTFYKVSVAMAWFGTIMAVLGLVYNITYILWPKWATKKMENFVLLVLRKA